MSETAEAEKEYFMCHMATVGVSMISTAQPFSLSGPCNDRDEIQKRRVKMTVNITGLE